MTDRNLLESDAARTPFYTTADGLFASADGRVLDRSGQPVAGSEGWGSDIASDRGCLRAWSRGDREQRQQRA